MNKEKTLPLRGVLALLITLHHIALALTYQTPEDSPVMHLRPFNSFGAPVVAVFFFLSGYGLMKSYRAKGEDYLQHFLTKRMSRILLPYLVCVLLYLPFNSAPLWGYDVWRLDSPLLPTSWFVVAITLCYLLFYFVVRGGIYAKIRTPWFTAIIFWVAMAYAQYKLREMGISAHWWNALLALSLGMTIALAEGRVLKVLTPWRAFGIALPLIAFCCYEGLDYITYTIIPIIVWLLVSFTQMPKCRALDWLGSISYEIYLVQGVVILRLFSAIGGHPLLHLTLSIVLSVVSAWILHLVVNRLLKYLNR